MIKIEKYYRLEIASAPACYCFESIFVFIDIKISIFMAIVGRTIQWCLSGYITGKLEIHETTTGKI